MKNILRLDRIKNKYTFTINYQFIIDIIIRNVCFIILLFFILFYFFGWVIGNVVKYSYVFNSTQSINYLDGIEVKIVKWW